MGEDKKGENVNSNVQLVAFSVSASLRKDAVSVGEKMMLAIIFSPRTMPYRT